MSSSSIWRVWIVVVLVVLALFAWTQFLVDRAEAEFTSQGSYVEVQGLRLRYVEKGTGQPIVLLHGVYGGLEDWEATIFDDVAQKGRAIAFDRPGHGFSDRPRGAACSPAEQARIVHAALMKLGVQRPVLVGFSFSGAIVTAYALQFPSETAGVMTVNGVLYEWEDISSTSDALLGLPLVGPVFAHTAAMPLALLLKNRSVANAFDPAPVSANFERSPIALEVRPSSLLANAADMRTLKLALRIQSPHYHEIRLPLAIVTGLGDRITNPHFHSYRIHEAVPGSFLFTVEGAGHQALYSHPRAVLHALDALLAEVERREHDRSQH